MKLENLPQYINGFKILSDLGIQLKGRNRTVLALCKICDKEFTAIWRNLFNYKSCGCLRYQLKPLPEFINGFRVIEDLGTLSTNSKNKRRYCVAECKVCGNHFKCLVSCLKIQNACSCSHNLPHEIKENARLLNIYFGMKSRCYNQNADNYSRYGGRGITICDEWLNDKFEFCKWALKNGYKKDLTIDRIDNDLGYSPSNCRWVTYLEQSKNKRK